MFYIYIRYTHTYAHGCAIMESPFFSAMLRAATNENNTDGAHFSVGGPSPGVGGGFIGAGGAVGGVGVDSNMMQYFDHPIDVTAHLSPEATTPQHQILLIPFASSTLHRQQQQHARDTTPAPPGSPGPPPIGPPRFTLSIDGCSLHPRVIAVAPLGTPLYRWSESWIVGDGDGGGRCGPPVDVLRPDSMRGPDASGPAQYTVIPGRRDGGVSAVDGDENDMETVMEVVRRELTPEWNPPVALCHDGEFAMFVGAPSVRPRDRAGVCGVEDFNVEATRFFRKCRSECNYGACIHDGVLGGDAADAMREHLDTVMRRGRVYGPAVVVRLEAIDGWERALWCEEGEGEGVGNSNNV